MAENFTSVGTPDRGRILLAHGAGAGSDSAYMQAFATGLAAHGFQAILFDFPYMALRKETGRRRPPDRAPKLLAHFHNVIKAVGRSTPLIIGGKSMGGRMASLIMAETPEAADGLVLLGYPFHPPGKPEKLTERTAHLSAITAPTLLVQGTRDTFGGVDLLEKLTLPSAWDIHWAPDGDHSLKPRKKSGHTEAGNWQKAVEAIAAKNWF